MAGIEFQGILKPADIQAELYPDVLWYQQQYYVNQYPLITGLSRIPVGTQSFVVRHTRYRPRVYPVGANMNNTDTYTVLTLANVTPGNITAANPSGVGDSTSLMAGDVLDIAGERVEVIATPGRDPGAMPALPSGQSTPSAGTVLVRRAVEGTTIAAHTTSATAKLISNSRDGGEVNQNGIRSRPVSATQYVQNWQYPVQVGGAVESESGAYGLQGGSQFMLVKAQQHDNMLRDMEKSAWYGIGEAPGFNADGTEVRMRQVGIKNQVITNQITPTSPTAYTPQNFLTDFLAPLWAVGSNPNVAFVGAAFLAGLSSWTSHQLRVTEGQTELGIKVDTYVSNLAPGLQIIPCISLEPGDVFVGMKELMFWRVKYGESFWPRGTRGYAYEGDWVAEGAVELRDQEKHAFGSGITGFAPPA